jgi:ubiquinone/menaquinone biosynthesis C-methylase UbiE
MKISQAVELIRTPLIDWSRAQSWCDLGCGSGTFTLALASSLATGSTIHAVDLDPKALEQIPDHENGIAIRKILGDLRSPSLRLPLVDGILMANSLHFIPSQHLFLKRLLSVTKRFLIVEYERSRPSPWVPYPVPFERLREVFNEAGIERVEKLVTLPSRFGGSMYAAFAEHQSIR